MCSTEEVAVWRARLIGYDRFRASPIRWELMAGYTADHYLDRPPGFTVYPGWWHLDKSTQVTDIAHVSGTDA